MNVLITGGAGYIGSHTAVALNAAGHTPIIVDNFSNSKPAVLDRLKQISGVEFPFFEGDVCDADLLDRVFSEHKIDSIIHFAGFKAVGESVGQPLKYYRNNLDSALSLLEAMGRHNVKSIVFSSSATVYGDPESVPIPETAALHATNPYGQTKLMIEHILKDVAAANKDLSVTILRYFNPIGAHDSGLIGEDPNGIPNNLLPYVSQVAVGKLQELKVYGDDYDTKDGTGVRDYIHVMDLAEGHVAAIEHAAQGVSVYNLGTGTGYSVLEVIKAFETASGKQIPYKIADRRPGDIAACYADPTLAQEKLEWKATRDLATMCHDAWNWQSKNPNGYEGD